jgi:hypothetical protein
MGEDETFFDEGASFADESSGEDENSPALRADGPRTEAELAEAKAADAMRKRVNVFENLVPELGPRPMVDPAILVKAPPVGGLSSEHKGGVNAAPFVF